MLLSLDTRRPETASAEDHRRDTVAHCGAGAASRLSIGLDSGRRLSPQQRAVAADNGRLQLAPCASDRIAVCLGGLGLWFGPGAQFDCLQEVKERAQKMLLIGGWVLEDWGLFDPSQEPDPAGTSMAVEPHCVGSWQLAVGGVAGLPSDESTTAGISPSLRTVSECING